MKDSEWNGLSGSLEEPEDTEPTYVGMIDDDGDDDDLGLYDDDDDDGIEAESISVGEKPDTSNDVVATVRTPGAYITMNSEAYQNATSQPMRFVDHKPTRRIGPNVYAVLSPSRQRPRRPNGGMGMGQARGGTISGSASLNIGGLVGGITSGLSQIGQTALQFRQQELQATADREARKIASQEAAAARRQEMAAQQQQWQAQAAEQKRQFQLQMAQIQAQRDAMIQQGASAAQAAAAVPAPPPPPMMPAPAAPSGMPPWAWALIAVGGVVVVGGVAYAVTKK